MLFLIGEFGFKPLLYILIIRKEFEERGISALDMIGPRPLKLIVYITFLNGKSFETLWAHRAYIRPTLHIREEA